MVLLGKGKQMSQDCPSFSREQLEVDQCHSVIAPGKVTSPHKDVKNLNYDEVVVYRDDAVLSSYLLIYK